jgi:hypothetical protein
MTAIFTILDKTKSEWKTTYYRRDDGEDARVISKDKWFRLYDQSNVQVNAPLTIED